MANDERDEFHPTQIISKRNAAPKKPPALKAYLAVLTGEKAGSQYPLPTDRRIVIGRSKDCDLTLDDRDASRRHASLQPFGTEFYLMDMGSTNGTQVNGRPVDKRLLRHGDRITVGKQVLQFLLVDADGNPYLLDPSGG
ncbi:MAG: FHA domain-containing protein [bacterium]|nr:MAG: FHA domain-containing protein [bacterium]